jgi:hypothetical protein
MDSDECSPAGFKSIVENQGPRRERVRGGQRRMRVIRFIEAIL